MKKLLALTLLFTLAGCSITKTPEFVGGDRNSGVVRLAYNLPPLQVAQVDNYTAQSNATRACQSWGYATAVPYGNPVTTCTMTSASECLNEQVTLSWQCYGSLARHRPYIIKCNTGGEQNIFSREITLLNT